MKFVKHVRADGIDIFVPLQEKKMSDINLGAGDVIHAVTDDNVPYGSFGCVEAPKESISERKPLMISDK